MRTSHFLAIVFTALALAPGAAHLMEMPAKIAMPEQPYFIVQQIYRGWAWAGVAIFAALFANLASAVITRHHRREFWLSTAAGLLIASMLAIFFVWTYPANQATGNWTSVPENWEQLRIQWEYSHAVNAVLTFFALLCSVGAALSSAPRVVVADTTARDVSHGDARRA
jgi:MFS family permease